MANRPDADLGGLLRYLGDTWTVDILRALAARSRRFCELEQHLSIPANTLARLLRALERDGFVCRFESPVLQRQVEYELSGTGRSFFRVAMACRDWAATHQTSVAAARRAFARASLPLAPDGAAPRGGQVRGVLASADLTHVAVVVRDLNAAVRAWAAVFAIDVPAIIESEAHVPEGGTVPVRHAWLAFHNLQVNLIEPVGRGGPFRRYAATHGEGFYYLGFTADDVPARVGVLKAAGGRHVLGHDTCTYGEIDFGSSLGATIEVNGRGAREFTGKVLQGCRQASLGSTGTVSSLTIGVGDLATAARQYLAIGLPTSTPRTVHFLEHSRRGRRRGRATMATIRRSGLALNVIQPDVGGLLKIPVERRGSAFLEMGFCVAGSLEPLVASLEHSGGCLVAGEPDAGYVQMDLRDRLGVVLDLTRTAPRRTLAFAG